MNKEWLRAGKILGGIGAGMTGQTQQWDQNNLLEKQYAQDEQLRQQQAQQQAKLAEMERMKTQYRDSVPALQFAKDEDWESFIKLGQSRQQLLKNHPTADGKDSTRLTEWGRKAMTGTDEEKAEAKKAIISELESNVKLGKALRIIEDEEGVEYDTTGYPTGYGRNKETNQIERFKMADGVELPKEPGQSPYTGVSQDPETGVWRGFNTTNNRVEVLDADQALMAKPADPKDPAQETRLLIEHRKNISNLGADTRKSRVSLGKIKQSVNAAMGKKEAPAADMATVFFYLKMLDPGSTVMQGEQATAENARGTSDEYKNFYNKIVTGETLTDKQRQDFLARSVSFYDVTQAASDLETSKILSQAKADGMDPAKILGGDEYQSYMNRRNYKNIQGNLKDPNTGKPVMFSIADIERSAREKRVPFSVALEMLGLE